MKILNLFDSLNFWLFNWTPSRVTTAKLDGQQRDNVLKPLKTSNELEDVLGASLTQAHGDVGKTWREAQAETTRSQLC